MSILEELLADSLLSKENSNQYTGPSKLVSMAAEKIIKEEAKQTIPSPVWRLHEEGYIYIHKLPLAIYLPYCTGHSVSRVLKKGLRTQTVDSKPARHFDTYVDHLANYLITLQHYFTGAQAFSSVEWYAGPFIRRDGLDYKAVKQNIQRLIFNLNYPSRVGMQTPFTNFTVALDAPKKMLNGDHAIYDGKEVEPLGEYREEAKTFLLALTDILYEGDAHGKPFTFPIPTLMATAPMIWEDPELYDAIFRTASRRGSFYWLNTRVVDPDEAFAMCCRLSIDKNELKFALSLDNSNPDDKYAEEMEKRMFGGVWATPDTTGSINVIDVNLPRIALESRGDDTRFWELYDEMLMSVILALRWFRSRYIKLIQQYPDMYYMIRQYLPEFPSSHFNTIGLIGLPEAVAILMQEPKLWFEEGRRRWMEATGLMKKIVEHATQVARKAMRETHMPFNVEEVPGESAAAKLAMKDLAVYPELAEYLPDADNPIYSTSIAPYYGELELADRIEIESKVQKYFTGGVMMHIFLGEEPDPDALARLTKRLIQTDLIYWSYTPAITYCPRCGRTYTGLYRRCPVCGTEDVEVWSRIIGYYRPLKNWNPYRRKEFWLRKHYKG